MATRDIKRKPYIEDNDENIFIGIDLPFRNSDGVQGYFASTSTTIEAVKVNIKNLLQTHQGERLMQPGLGLNLRDYLFEQFTPDVSFSIQNDIVNIFRRWLPFVQVKDIQVSMSESDLGLDKNLMNINITFNITQDPNTLESVSLVIGE